MQSRLAFLQQVERRYGKSIDELIAEADKWREELDSLELENEQRTRLEKEVRDKLERLREKALELSRKRERAAAQLDRRVTSSLREMRMPDVVFRTDIEFVESPDGIMDIEGKKIKIFQDGIDRVEFFIITNKGEKEGRVCEIASTGETSRIALALKDVISSRRKSSVLVFDELDAGIGADMGEAIAEKLLSLSGKYQIIAITHMPQIAAAAHRHLVVSKRVEGGRTRVEVEEVRGGKREEELARMLGGGGDDMEKVLALASEMLHARKARRDYEGMRP
jgi:DNA repair protein RecN (Recombination protein N)